jgi:hypothetical protein
VVDVPAGDQNRGGTWAEDGYIYAAPDTILPLQRVPENGGAFEDVTTLDPARRERTHRWPEALPGGAVVFTCDTLESTESYDDARIEVLLPGTGERKVLVEQSSRARYLASGHLVFARGGALFAVSFDRETLEVHGKPVVVLQGVATTVASGAAHFALSPTGTLAYVPGEMSEGVRPPFWIDRASGAQEPSTIEVAPTALELSPDGRRAALLLSEAGSLDLWVADLERGTANRLTFTGNAQSPVWSRDGRWVAFTDRDGVYRQSTESAGAPELLLRVDPSVVDRTYPTSFTLDGEALMVEYPPGPDQQADLGLVQIGSDPTRPPTPVVATPNRDAMGVVSPDGRWLAYISVESGRASLYVRSLEPGGSPWLISRPAWEPRWSADGREVYYRAGLGDLWVTTMEGGTPQRITSGLRTGDGAHQYGVAPDGLRFLSLGLNEFHEVDRIHLLLDWDREVRRLGSRNR